MTVNNFTASASLRTALSNFAGLVNDVYSEVRDYSKLEVEVARKAYEDGNAFGAWKDIFDPQVTDLQTQVQNEIPFDPLAPSLAATSYSSLIGALFGGVPLFNNVSALTGAETTLQAQALQGGSGTPQGLCASTSSVPQALQGVTSIVASKIKGVADAAKATFGVLLGAKPEDMGSGMAHLMFSLLLKLSGAQNILLDQIIDEVQKINEDIEKLTADDYSTDHRLLLSQVYTHVITADNIIVAQLNNLLARDNNDEPDSAAKFLFPLNRTGLANAEAALKRARALLCGQSLEESFQGILSLRALRIAVRLIYLETLLNLLEASETELETLTINLGSFDTAFERLTYFDELTTPILSLLHCRLGILASDVLTTLEQNQILTFFLKEKIWCFELFVLIQLLKVTDLFDIDTSKIFSKQLLGRTVKDLFGDVKDLGAPVEIPQIRGLANAYIKNVKYKLSYNVDPLFVTRRADVLIRLIERRKAQNEKFKLIAGTSVLELEAGAFTAVQLVLGLIAAMSAAGLGKSVKQLQTGDIKGFFSSAFDGISGEFNAAFQTVRQELERSGCKLADLGNNVVSMYGIVEGKGRSDSLFNEALDGFPETYLKATLEGSNIDQPAILVDTDEAR